LVKGLEVGDRIGFWAKAERDDVAHIVAGAIVLVRLLVTLP